MIPDDQQQGEPTIRDSSEWTVDGDFELISSANVRYRVPSYYLQSNSSVFRDMLSLGGNIEKKIHFTDDACERSSVLLDFLGLVVKGRFYKMDVEVDDGLELELVINSDDDIFMRSVRLLRFLQKYDCTLAKNLLLAELQVLLHKTRAAPQFAFALAAIAGEVDMCESALMMANRHARKLPIKFELKKGCYSIRPLDFGMVAWSVIPQAYQWALIRTQDMITNVKGTEDGNVALYFSIALHDAREQQNEANA